MINITQGGWAWDLMDSQAPDIYPTVFSSPASRVSELLGPDGEPLMIGYERPKLGFDLRRRK